MFMSRCVLLNGERMTPRITRMIAWLLVGIYIILAGAGLTLQGLVHTSFTQTGLPVLIFLVSLVGIWIVTGAMIISLLIV